MVLAGVLGLMLVMVGSDWLCVTDYAVCLSFLAYTQKPERPPQVQTT